MPKPDLHLERIRELIEIMRESGVCELSVELPELKISLKRDPRAVETADVPAERPAQALSYTAGADSLPTLVPVVAPVVGTFRATTEQGDKIAAGDSIASGQVIGAIEAMKVPNEVAAPVSGIVREVLASDGAPVEYGQPLMLIEPLAVGEGVGDESEAL